MTDESYSCGSTAVVETTDAAAGPDRWIDDRPIGQARLPDDVRRVMSAFYPLDSVETIDDFVAASRTVAGGGSLGVEDLCHVDGETPHVARTTDETYRFRCFFDGVALSYLVDQAVEIRTESPGGDAVELTVTPDGTVDSSPADAVMSLGIATDAADVADPTAAQVYEAVCTYVKAFPSRAAYLSWAAAVDGATVGLPLADGVPIATALAE
jgi:hypothetical protein